MFGGFRVPIVNHRKAKRTKSCDFVMCIENPTHRDKLPSSRWDPILFRNWLEFVDHCLPILTLIYGCILSCTPIRNGVSMINDAVKVIKYKIKTPSKSLLRTLILRIGPSHVIIALIYMNCKAPQTFDSALSNPKRLTKPSLLSRTSRDHCLFN